MRIQLFSLLSFIHFCLILLIVSVSSQCLNDQKSILIQLKNTIFDLSFSTKIVSWNQSTDCCSWKGVTCSKDGHVIGLDLSNERITFGIENSSPLFSLHFLRSLNLAQNFFYPMQIPSGIGNLTNLAYLNLSDAAFSGQIPGELSNLIRLVTLDLSSTYNLPELSLILENPSLAMLLQNLKELTELKFDGVNISAQGYDWCQDISSSLPKLKVLSLSNCFLSGPIDASFEKLQSLSVIRLSQNNLSGPFPEFIANFTNLTVLELSSCELYGRFPREILQVPTLEILDLSNNNLLNGFLPIFPQNASLQSLVLSNTSFSQALPDSIGNLRMLSTLDLSHSNFNGQIPDSMASLTQLVYLDLSYNMFSGPIPSFDECRNLAHVILGYNAFNGSIPPSLFDISSLQDIRLPNNNFHGLLANFPNASSSLLEILDLSSNRLEGPIPKSFFDLRRLRFLYLSNNQLNGTADLEAFSGLGSLTHLDLSYNNLSLETRDKNSILSNVPKLTTLNMASCKLQYFPNLKNYSVLIVLDLSNNQIGGEIPSWIWNIGERLLDHLNLSHNALENLQEPYVLPPLTVLDLHANKLRGNIPVPTRGYLYVDYSINHFNSSLPDSICKARNLQFLDFSNNSLIGVIPSCLIKLNRDLRVLNLGKNNLSGNIPDIFPRKCSLETLDLHGNLLEGKVPESLGSCSMLEVLSLGNNLVSDTFPCFLNKCTNLRVLALRSNKLHGDIQCSGATKVWSKLQIIDLASNYFTGQVPRSFFLNLRAMIAHEDDEQSKLNYLHLEVPQVDEVYYVDKVTVVMKGNVMELVKILTIFTSIDFSNNRFSGGIPRSIGGLKALHLLNMSHNAFTGSIPASIGNLKQLDSLDLSVNNLTGRIPTELGSLTFLSFLNLSYNLLEGRIPAGSQLQTFTETSFEGNKGLCGSELNISCVFGPSPSPSEEVDRKGETSWDLISFEVGLVVGLATVIAPLVLSRRWSEWYFKHVDRIVVAKVYRYYQRRNQERKSPIRRL